MSATEPLPRTVIVAGDVTIDWNIARSRRVKASPAGWEAGGSTRAWWQRGGAALLADLIEVVAGELHESAGIRLSIRQAARPGQAVLPGDTRFHHTHSLWSPFKAGEKPPLDKEKPVWRMEEFIGVDLAAPPEASAARAEDDTPQASLVVLTDANLGFRDKPDCWPVAVQSNEQQPWFLLKMVCPVTQGHLWECIQERHAGRTIIVMTVDDLRLSEVQISRELSWERTAQDLAWELVHNPRVNTLARCAFVVVSFGPAGAVLLSRQPSPQSNASDNIAFQLFFDPKVIEGMWEQDFPGGMIGYTTCLTAGIARQIMLNPQQPDLKQGILSGLAAMRRLHRDGFGEPGTSASQSPVIFPIQRIAGELANPAAQFAIVDIQDPLYHLKQPLTAGSIPLTNGFWTILQDRYRSILNQVAYQIVLEGPDTALQAVPLGQFGSLLTLDRHEIESYRSIRTLVGEYCRQGQQKRPLSIAVFGAPGSGKSFGITEVANSLLPGQIEVLEFNLSQLGSPADLLAALHRVRDAGLSGKIPLVFWDEFDTQLDRKALGWLRYFLAPMQDGKFQEGQVTHPIGRSIFVFAGGTSSCLADFGQGLDPEDYRTAKGPDFISRLKGYVNILGPNRQQGACEDAQADPYYIIRRAILLRSLLKRNVPHLFEKRGAKELLNIDRGVLRAMLETRLYKHGVRSIESIIAMSLLAGKSSFERSCLPSEAQLDLHVDGRDFLALVQRMDLEGDLLEQLAEAAHQVYCEGLRGRGYSTGPVTDPALKTHALLVPYPDLAEELKEQNRNNVRDIALKLALVGYVMVPARSNEPAFDFPGDDLDRLAENEHERWMQARQANGWRYAPVTDETAKTHASLVAYADLPEEEKDKDRDLVGGIPSILARVGYAIIRANP